MTRPRTQSKNIGSFLAFNSDFFTKYQKRLLWLLNSQFTRRWFRWVLRIRKGDIGYHKTIEWILPNAYAVKGSKEGEFIADFRTHPKYGKRLYYSFKPLWWGMHFWDWLMADRFVPRWSFGFSTLTAFPDANPETTTVDGNAGYTTPSSSWTTMRTSTGNNATDSDTILTIGYDPGTTNYQYLQRGFALFDTSSLTSGATISAAVLSLKGTKYDFSGQTPALHVASATPASNTAIAGSDFTNVGTTSFANIAYASWSDTLYNDFTLDSNGRNNISKTGVSKFSLQVAQDINNSAPAHTGNGQDVGYNPISADNAGTSSDPKLVVTYTANVTTTKTQTGVARIQKSVTKTQTGKARITATTTKTQTGKAAIQKTTSKTQTGLSRIQKTVTQTITGLSRMIGSTVRTITGVANIRNTTLQTQTGVGRIQKTVTQLQTGAARIQKTVTQTIQGVANIFATTAKTITGLARITATTLKTQAGVARITATTTRAIIGLARVLKTATQTITGKALIAITTTRTQTGVGKISATTTKTITGISFIRPHIDYSDKHSVRNTSFGDKYSNRGTNYGDKNSTQGTIYRDKY